MQIDQDHLDVIRELNGISIKDEAATLDDINEKFERSIKGDEIEKATERRQKSDQRLTVFGWRGCYYPSLLVRSPIALWLPHPKEARDISLI